MISAVPGQALNTTLTLPGQAQGPVRWAIRDHTGKLIVQGLVPPVGAIVSISTTLPAECVIPEKRTDRYVISATDGKIATSEYFAVLSATDPVQNDHGMEISYILGRPLKDTILLGGIPQAISYSVALAGTNQQIVPETAIAPNSFVQFGPNYSYSMNAGVVDTRPNITYGMGHISWIFVDQDGMEQIDIHPFYTISPRVMYFMNGIRKLADRVRLNDIHPFLNITTTDLIHAVLRGADYVAQSPPLMTGFALDTIPMPLSDFIIKAGVIDLLEAQYLAEGMSAFDFQGLGVQLTMDRTQYLQGLLQELKADMDKLEKAKDKWIEAGKPIGPEAVSGNRPLGVLGVTIGAHTNIPVMPLGLVGGIYNMMRYIRV